MLGSCTLDCDTAVWEVKLCCSNPKDVMIGVRRSDRRSIGNLDCSLNEVDKEGDQESSWFLDWSDAGVSPTENDVVSVYWDQTDFPMLSFHLNGEVLPGFTATNRIRPSSNIYPAVSLKNGAGCDVIFSEEGFHYPPKNKKFNMIVCATSLI